MNLILTNDEESLDSLYNFENISNVNLSPVDQKHSKEQAKELFLDPSASYQTFTHRDIETEIRIDYTAV